MSNSKIADTIDRHIDKKLSSKESGSKLLRKQGLDTKRLLDVAPVDDGIPPRQPTNLTLTPFITSITLSWESVAPHDDYVSKVYIEYQAGSSAAVTVTTNEISQVTLFDLNSNLLYKIRIMFEDRWGRKSPWSHTTAPDNRPSTTPLESAQTVIDNYKSGSIITLSNMIDNLNTKLLDPNSPHFAEGVVSAIALTQSNNTNILTMRETDFEMWRPEDITAWDGTWPPPETVGSGANLVILNQDNSTPPKPYITALPQGHTPYKIVTFNNRKWLQDTRPVGAANTTSYPFSNWSTRGTFTNNWYIYSAYVKGTAGQSVRLVVQASNDSIGTNVVTLATGSYTLTGDIRGERIWVMFQTTSGSPYLRFGLGNQVEGQTVYWSKFQLEMTTAGKTEPSPWSAGVFTTGVIGARMIGAIDLSAANAIFKDAAIDDAKIGGLTADKILTGTLKAGRSITVLGNLYAGTNAVIISKDGLIVTDGATSTGEDPSAKTANWITPPVNPNTTPQVWAGVGFVNQSTTEGGSARRGILLKAYGVQGSPKDGVIKLVATNGTLNDASASVGVITIASSDTGFGKVSFNGRVTVYDRFTLDPAAYFEPAYSITPTTIAASTANRAFNHNLGHIPMLVIVQYRDPQDSTRWYGISRGDVTDGVTWEIDNTSIYIQNNAAAARVIRCWIVSSVT